MKTFTCQEEIFTTQEKTFATPNIQCDKRFIAMTERTALAQMLWDLKEAGDGLSLSKMAARSGGLVAVSTLHGVMSGKSKKLTPDVVLGLSRILNITEDKVLSALREKSGAAPKANGFTESDFARLYFKHKQVKSKARQREYERILQMVERDYDRDLLEQNKREADDKSTG